MAQTGESLDTQCHGELDINQQGGMMNVAQVEMLFVKRGDLKLRGGDCRDRLPHRLPSQQH